ncbi:MAG: PorT family protein [Sporocytophaga sp.]|nr:PorT family protein [Sporocytophaga sp.]
MKFRFLLLLLFVSFHSYSQIKFEKGYFIDSENQKTECLIKDSDWRNNPLKFKYKLGETDEVKEEDISSVTEFCIYNGAKYVRANVKIDRSSQELSSLSNKRNPEYVEEQLFLRVVEEGAATLYSYRDPGISKLFYKVNNLPIEQLVYKEYYTADGFIATNAMFRQQLFLNVNCNKSISANALENISYKEKELEKYFQKYNECMGDTIPKQVKKKRDLFNLRITPGFSYSTFSLKDNFYKIDFDKKLTFRVGLQTEFVLPFYKNKWSVIFEPTYQYFNSKGKNSSNDLGKIKYSCIEFPIGIRHYFFLSEKLKLFVNGLFITNMTLKFNSSLVTGNEPMGYYSFKNLEAKDSFGLGAGIENNRISAEIRYCPQRSLTNSKTYTTNFSRLSLLIGFKVF